MKGYGGRILFVDLTRGTSRVEALDETEIDAFGRTCEHLAEAAPPLGDGP